ncbi:hypothetical protein [Sphingomonas sp.]|uniref:hypothetical protein n=1 Tax=Sphingomonas sp. TaxID=28214 RepID=UPI0026008647|nr:hypothetical protein [Sphingomonas sp.]
MDEIEVAAGAAREGIPLVVRRWHRSSSSPSRSPQNRPGNLFCQWLFDERREEVG